MTVSFSCPDCDKALRVAGDKRGKRINCPGCGSVITIPDDDVDSNVEAKNSRRSKNTSKSRGKHSGRQPAWIPITVGAGVVFVTIVIGLLAWPGRQAGSASEGDKDKNRMRLQRLTLAMHSYHDANQQFPIVDKPEFFGTDGRPFLSWRVHLLPYLDQSDLYKKFHLNEPWDSPHNKTLLDKMPDEFQSGISGGSSTGVLALTGPSALFYQRKVGRRDITDGVSNTAMFVQVGPDKVVPWTKPDDIVFDPANPLAAFGRIGKTFLCGMASGMILEFDSKIDAKTMASIASPKGNEVINVADFTIQPAKRTAPEAPGNATTNPVSPPTQIPQPTTSIGIVQEPQRTLTPSSPLLTGGTTVDLKVFKIQLPMNWQVFPDPVVALHSRPHVNQLFPNIKIAILKPPPGTPIEKIVNDSKELYMKNGRVDEAKETIVQGRTVHRLLMNQNLPGNPNRQLKYFIPAGERVLIFTGEDTSIDFASSLRYFDAMMNSLQVGE